MRVGASSSAMLAPPPDAEASLSTHPCGDCSWKMGPKRHGRRWLGFLLLLCFLSTSQDSLQIEGLVSQSVTRVHHELDRMASQQLWSWFHIQEPHLELSMDKIGNCETAKALLGFSMASWGGMHRKQP